MKLFTRSKPEPDLLARIETLERAQKALAVDWDEYYERFRRLLAKLAKRAADEERRASEGDAGVSSAPRLPQDRRTGGHPITNPLARRLLSGPFNGEEE